MNGYIVTRPLREQEKFYVRHYLANSLMERLDKLTKKLLDSIDYGLLDEDKKMQEKQKMYEVIESLAFKTTEFLEKRKRITPELRDEIAKVLIEQAESRGARDNVTVMIIEASCIESGSA